MVTIYFEFNVHMFVKLYILKCCDLVHIGCLIGSNITYCESDTIITTPLQKHTYCPLPPENCGKYSTVIIPSLSKITDQVDCYI